MNFPTKENTISYSIIRIGLMIGACGWLISFYFTFRSWDENVSTLMAMGADKVSYQPLLNYWLKMASSTFGCLGIMFLIASFRPDKFKTLSFMLAGLSAIVGTVILFSAINENLNPDKHLTFTAEITFCYLRAALIVIPCIVPKSSVPESLDP